MIKQGITLRELAQEAGVSITAASQVLNDRPCRVSEATRKRILETAARNRYYPNGVAKSLVTSQTHTLGFLIPDITNPFFVGIARGIEDCAREQDYNVIFCSTDDCRSRENQSLRMLMERGIDGLIIAHTADQEEDDALLPQLRIPTIMIDREYPLPEQENQLGHVLVDNRRGAREAVNYLLQSGRRSVALLGGPEKASSARERRAGYLEALEKAGIQPDPKLLSSGSYTQESGLRQMKEMLEHGGEFDALFCANDLLAMGAIRVLKQQGLSVPGDKAVVGFDDNPFAAVSSPSLTTVRQPQYEMGRKACEILLERLSGNGHKEQEQKKRPVRVVLPTVLVLRESA